MKKNNKILVFPFDKEFLPVIRNKDMFSHFDFSQLIALSGFGLNNKDAGIADDGESIGMIVKSDFEGSLNEVDTVWITKPKYEIDFEKLVFPRINEAIKRKKNIVCLWKLDISNYEKIENLCKENKVKFEYYVNDKILKISHEQMRQQIDTPIIVVSGDGENIQKFSLQLALRNEFKKLGYKVSQIGTKHYCELLGFHSFPRYVFNNKLNDADEVFLFNGLIKKIESEETPDVIIIGIPGSVKEINDQYNYSFGCLANKINKSITSDFTIHCTSKNINKDYYHYINNYYLYNFNLEIDCFHISNEMKRISMFDEFNQKNTFSYNYRKILELVDKDLIDQNLFLNILDLDSKEKLVKRIIEVLTEEDNEKIFDYVNNFMEV